MEIAILTLPLRTNYGGILQAFALQTVIERMGYPVEHLQKKVIEYQPLHPKWQMPLVWINRLIRKYIGGDRNLPVFGNPYKWMRKNTDSFINEYIHCRYLDLDEWTEALSEDYDTFIVGSDQVWRPRFSEGIEKYFLDFLKNVEVKRIAYSASFGVDTNEYTEEQIKLVQPLVQKFEAVSVREESGIDLCEEVFGVSATHVLDPTMLLSMNDYLSLIKEEKKSAGNLMVYVLDESPGIDSFVSYFASSRKLIPFRANSRDLNESEKYISDKQQPPVEDWLRAFRDAGFVITDSFHACVFSILFKKPFLCIGNDFRGMARFHSLLGQFGLMDRLVSITDLRIPDKEIDWNRVYEILEDKRAESMDFLRRSLS